MIISAAFNDGRTAGRHPVRLTLDGGQLLISDDRDGGGVLARWKLEDIHRAAPAEANAPLLLRHGFDGGERLTVPPGDGLVLIKAHCPNWRKTGLGLQSQWRPLLLWTGGAVAAVAFLIIVVIPLLANQAVGLISADMENRLGRTIATQIIEIIAISQRKPPAQLTCRDGAAAGVLNKLAATLAGGLERPPPVQLRIIEADVLNAFALPGGHIFVFRKLIEFSRNANELAGVVAHEIAHLDYRHPLQVAIEKMGGSVFFGLLLGDITGGTLIAGTAELALGAGYTRKAEREADALGVRLMNRAGFDARPLADFQDRLGGKATDGDGLAALFSTHPPAPERAAVIRAGATAKGRALSEKDWRMVKRACR